VLFRLGSLPLVLKVKVSQEIAMNPENRQDAKNGEVRYQDREIEGIHMVNAAERVLVE
jgi:hypothetical protein